MYLTGTDKVDLIERTLTACAHPLTKLFVIEKIMGRDGDVEAIEDLMMQYEVEQLFIQVSAEAVAAGINKHG
jgi:hypothetical protein